MTANEGTRREKQGRQVDLPMVMRLSDCAVRFLLSAVLAGAELMGGHSLFALALVGVCKPGLEGLAALLGAALGYLSFRGVLEGLRYIAASMMVYAVALAMGAVELYHRRLLANGCIRWLRAYSGRGHYQRQQQAAGKYCLFYSVWHFCMFFYK